MHAATKTSATSVTGVIQPLHAFAEARMHEATFEILHAAAGAEPVTTVDRGDAAENRQQADACADCRPELWAQGDILLERVADAQAEPDTVERVSVTIAHGELSGHRHTVHGRVKLAHHAALARDMPAELYLGHLLVIAGPALLRHEQHGPIALREGTYRVRRQRHLEPADASVIGD